MNRLRTAISNREHQVAQHTRGAINEEIAQIIDEALLSPEIETIVIRVSQRIFLSLIRRYWALWMVLILGISVVQSILLAFLLKFILKIMR